MRRNPLKQSHQWLTLPGAKFFSNDALELAVDESGWDSRTTVVAMTPDEFLRMAARGRDEDKQTGVNDLMQRGVRFNSMLRLLVDVQDPDVARCVGHEGRHRARALRAAKVSPVPVVVLVRGGPHEIRWSAGPRLPRVLWGEDGTNHMSFPESEVWVK